MQSAELPNSHPVLEDMEINNTADAVVMIATALEISGHPRDYVAGVIAAERMHGCLRAGAPLWVPKVGAETYRRAARTNSNAAK